jgi:hypothetical protein
MSYEEDRAVTSIQKSLTLLNLDEEDKNVVEFVFNNDWASVRDLIGERKSNLSLKLVCCICSIGPPQSVIIAIARANARVFAEIDDKGRHPLHYLCQYGSPTFAIVYAAQVHIAALQQKDANKKTPLDLLMTMPWEYHKDDKDQVLLELQKCHSLKCYDSKSKLPNQVALERWGHKVVLEEKIKCFMVCFVECARFEKAEDWDGCSLSYIAEEINNKCHDAMDEVRRGGNVVHVNPYRLISNQFVIIAKTQTLDDCRALYKLLCLKKLGELKHESMFLRLGCVYCEEVIGANALKELLTEAEELQSKVKENIELATLAVSTALNDVTGESKVNVSAFTESYLKDFVARDYIPDHAVSSSSFET